MKHGETLFLPWNGVLNCVDEGKAGKRDCCQSILRAKG